MQRLQDLARLALELLKDWARVAVTPPGHPDSWGCDDDRFNRYHAELAHTPADAHRAAGDVARGDGLRPAAADGSVVDRRRITVRHRRTGIRGRRAAAGRSRSARACRRHRIPLCRDDWRHARRSSASRRCGSSISGSRARNGNARWRRRGAARACSWSSRGCSDRLRSAPWARTASRRACRCRTDAPTARSASWARCRKGILRQSIRRGDEYVDQVLWSILKEDWGEHWVSTAPRVH